MRLLRVHGKVLVLRDSPGLEFSGTGPEGPDLEG